MCRIRMTFFLNRRTLEPPHLGHSVIHLKPSEKIEEESLVPASVEYVGERDYGVDEITERVLNECAETNYYDKVCLPGFREERYFKPMEMPEVTLVHYLSRENAALVKQFTQMVDEELPGNRQLSLFCVDSRRYVHLDAQRCFAHDSQVSSIVTFSHLLKGYQDL